MGDRTLGICDPTAFIRVNREKCISVNKNVAWLANVIYLPIDHF